MGWLLLSQGKLLWAEVWMYGTNYSSQNMWIKSLFTSLVLNSIRHFEYHILVGLFTSLVLGSIRHFEYHILVGSVGVYVLWPSHVRCLAGGGGTFFTGTWVFHTSRQHELLIVVLYGTSKGARLQRTNTNNIH